MHMAICDGDKMAACGFLNRISCSQLDCFELFDFIITIMSFHFKILVYDLKANEGVPRARTHTHTQTPGHVCVNRYSAFDVVCIIII